MKIMPLNKKIVPIMTTCHWGVMICSGHSNTVMTAVYVDLVEPKFKIAFDIRNVTGSVAETTIKGAKD